MRIITGAYKGRRLESPVGDAIRPTTDKVKEAIFNLLMWDVEDAVCVDLFAGTGNLGLEALSRGARRCYFCDNAKDSLRLIRANIEKCGAADRAVVIAGDAIRVLQRIREPVDLFFLDPPYRAGLYVDCLRAIDERDLLRAGGRILAEHGVREPMPAQVGALRLEQSRRYGKVMVSLYGRASAQTDDAQAPLPETAETTAETEEETIR